MKSIIEKNKNKINRIRSNKKDKWVKSLKTSVPLGLNMKLNHPTWKK